MYFYFTISSAKETLFRETSKQHVVFLPNKVKMDRKVAGRI